MSKKKIMKCIYTGCVCTIHIYDVPASKNTSTAKLPSQKIVTEEERLRHLAGMSCRRHTELCNANWHPGYLFCTLTFDNRHLPTNFQAAKHICKNYWRRLKRTCPDAVIFLYLGRGGKKKRIHVHMVCFGIPEDIIRSKWECGQIDEIEHLREHNYYNGIDHGQDYTGLATYLWKHWTPEQGGRRWKNTKNVRQPEVEITETTGNFSLEKPPVPPKDFVLVGATSTEYGLLSFKFVHRPTKKEEDWLKVDTMHWRE